MINNRCDDPIVQVIEVMSEETANVYLHQKWLLLDTGFATVEGTPTFLYCLGLPKSIYESNKQQIDFEHNLNRIQGTL